MHRMRVLSRRLKFWAFFFSFLTAIPLLFAVLVTTANGITERSLFLAAAVLLCLFVAGVLWLAYGFAWAMTPAMAAEEAPREKETRLPLTTLHLEENRPPLLSPSAEKEYVPPPLLPLAEKGDRSPLLSLHIEKENRPPVPSPPVEKEEKTAPTSLTEEKENRPPPPSPPAEEKKEKKKKEKEEEPIYTITGRRIN